MYPQKLPYFLILLVMSSFCDDLWACSTPNPDDDAVAAENNDYLASARTLVGGQRCKGEGAWHPTTFPGAGNPRPAEHLLYLTPETDSFVLFDRDPLFGFMSLQR
jgi:hypothetical protein